MKLLLCLTLVLVAACGASAQQQVIESALCVAKVVDGAPNDLTTIEDTVTVTVAKQLLKDVQACKPVQAKDAGQ